MSRTRHPSAQFLSLAAAVLLANCAFAVTAAGQGTPAELPADCSAYASVPLPAEADNAPVPKTSPACASYRSYRGIGRPVNYSEARACAWKERLAQKAEFGQNQDEPIAWVVGGSLILADIYFNGAGVKRNIPLAIRFACESEEAMAKLALPDITKPTAPLRAHRPFEFCDYAVTTFTMNFCGGYESQIEDDQQKPLLRFTEISMTPEQRAAFEKLLAAQGAYIKAHASEVDQGGTIRVIRTIGSEGILKDLFHAELVHFERKKWPALSDVKSKRPIPCCIASMKRAPPTTNADKGRDRSREPSRPTIFRTWKQAWQAYRDAWVAFARLRYPAAVAVIRVEITLDRYRLLKTIA